MNPKLQIIKSLQKLTGEKDIKLNIPEREEFGDYSSNVAMTTFENSKLQIPNSKWKNVREYADYLKAGLQKDQNLMDILEKIEIAGPGFINFHLKTDVLLNNLIQIDSDDYGNSTILKGKKYAVEFAHPNTHKAFHIGHLRNIITGESLSRILSSAGADIKRVNYQGDVGLHIAKAIWGIKKLGLPDTEDILERASFLGKAYTEGSSAYEEGDSKKEEIHKINESLYKGEDTNLMELYKKTRQWSLDYFDYIYKRVDSKFDRFYFESEVADEGLRLAKEALEKKILIESEGAVIFPGQKAGLHDRVFITSRGVPTYEGKDLGLAKLQFSELHPDLIIHVVGPEQADYFKVVFRALERIVPESKGKEVHIPYGWVKLKDGKMSSRSGNVVLGNWLLDEAKKKIREKYKSDSDTAEKIAVGAVKYSFLRNSLSQEIAFDLEESVALEGNSGPYLQYTYARTQSVLRKGERVKMPFGSAAQDKQESKKKNERGKYVITSGSSVIASEAKQSQPFNKEELSLMKSLFHFPEIVESAAQSYAPNIICNYLYDLAQKFNTFYNKHRIINAGSEGAEEKESGEVVIVNKEDVILEGAERPIESSVLSHPEFISGSDTQQFRLLLTASTGTILKSGLSLLGIQAPERM